MAYANIEKGKIVAAVGGNPTLVAVMRSLPEARFRSKDQTWSAIATPMAAHRLVYDNRIDTALASETLHDLAMEFEASLVPGDYASIDRIGDHTKATQPWRHQQDAIAFAVNKYAVMLAMEMGCGKSLAAVLLASIWQCRTVVVLCPRSVIGVWRREFARHFPDMVDVDCLEKGTGKRKALQVENFFARGSNALRVVVVNYEAAWREPLAAALLDVSPDLTILDESHRIKSHDGKASKFAYQLGKRSTRRLCLTGTPMPHSPLDLYAQFRFLEPALFGTSFTRFRSQYARCNALFASKVDEWINQDELKELYSKLTFRVESADVLDLPSCLHEQRKFELSPKTMKAYEEMENDMLTAVGDEEITASNALVKLLRLQQITSGTTRSEDGAVVRIGTDKQDALKDMIVDIDVHEPIVVFCRFAADIEAIREVAESTGRRFGEISGRHKDLTPEATMPEGIDLMAVQEQAGGVGIDLTRARYVVWYSLSFSLGDYEQANARCHRPGQTRPVTVYHLVSEGTIDESVYRALDNRREVIDEVLSVLKPVEEVTV